MKLTYKNKKQMRNLELTTGQKLTLQELATTLGSSLIDFDKAERGEIVSMDNFDGENGYNIYFEIFDTSNCEYDDTNVELCFNPEMAIIKITSIDEL